MKKTVLKLFCLLLSLFLLMGLFVACNGEEDPGKDDPSDGPTLIPPTERELALALYRSVDEKMSAADSYAVKIDMELATSKDGIAIKATGTENEYFVNLKSSTQFSHLSHANLEMDMTYNGQKHKLENEMRSGYVDGKMFLNNKETQDGTALVDQKLYSSISGADYMAYYDEINENAFDLSDGDFSVATYKQNENGTVTASFSGFTASGLEKIPFFDEDFKEMFEKGKQPTDVVITLVVGADQYPLSLSLAFQFGNGGISTLAAAVMPELKISATYSGINATTMPAVDLTGFSSVGDLRAMEYANRAIKARLDAESGSFNTETVVVLSGNATTERSEVKQQIEYATATDGAYSYHVAQEQDGVKRTIEYKNGLKKDSTGAIAIYTDAKARAEIEASMIPGGFEVIHIKTVRVVSKDDTKQVYEFALNSSDEAASLAASLGLSLKSFTATATVIVENGQLTKYQYKLSVATTRNGLPCWVAVTTTVTF